MSRRAELRSLLKHVRAKDRRLESWMVDNYTVLMAEYGPRLDLRELSDVVRRLRLTNEHRAPPTQATISKTWARVRALMARAVPPQQAGTHAFPPGVVALVTPGLSERESAAPVQAPFQRRPGAGRPDPAPARPRVTPAPEALPRAVAPSTAGLSAAEQIARFREGQRDRTRQMPETVDLRIPN